MIFDDFGNVVSFVKFSETICSDLFYSVRFSCNNVLYINCGELEVSSNNFFCL